MKKMILAIFLLCVTRNPAFSDSKGHYYYSWDSDAGIKSGFLLSNQWFQLNLEGLYNYEDFRFQSFQFKSPNLEIGSMALKGSLQFMETHMSTFSFYPDDSEIETDRESSPQSNIGVLFKNENLGGIAAWRKENQSRIQGWLQSDFFSYMDVLLSSALSFRETEERPVAWFLEEKPVFSDFLLTNLLSLNLYEGNWQGGIIIYTSFAPVDSGGFSLSMYSILDWPQMYFLSEVEYISADCLLSDFKRSDYQWKLNNRISFHQWVVPSQWDILFFGKEGTVSLEIEEKSTFSFKPFILEINGKISLELSESPKNDFEYAISGTLKMEWKHLKGVLKLSGSKEDDIFHYDCQTDLSISLGQGEYFLRGKLQVDDSVDLTVSQSIIWNYKNMEFKAGFNLEQIGLYNSESNVEPQLIFALKIFNPQS